MVTDDKKPLAVSKEEWAATHIHKVSTYSCGKCGRRFESPDEVYAHLDEAHPEKAGA